MDRILVMRSFVCVADLGSFSAAARQLGVSTSLVSRHVADLERQLGVRLVNRTARSMSLTESGREYAGFARRILVDIEEEDALIAARRDRVEGQLSIISPKWIGSLDLGDAIAAFSVANPRITIRFELGGLSAERAHDFLDSGFDIALHGRPVRDSAVRIKRVAVLPFVLCASRGYARRNGLPRTLREVEQHDCLVHSNDPIWRLGEGPSAESHKVQRVVFSSNSYLALQKAAVSGRGIALLPQRACAQEMTSGALVRVLPEHRVPDRTLYAVHGPERPVARKVQAFLDFVTSWFVDNPMPDIDHPPSVRGGSHREQHLADVL